jgi:hypothetical protein
LVVAALVLLGAFMMRHAQDVGLSPAPVREGIK